MIKLGSKSYPYLAIAQHWNVPYAKVLAFSETLEASSILITEPWKVAVWRAYETEKERRKQAIYDLKYPRR